MTLINLVNYTRAFIRLTLLIPLSLLLIAPQQSLIANQFKFSDEDLKALGLPEGEAKQFVEILNNLSPEEIKQIEDVGRKMEEKMRASGLNPTNPDDLMKFMQDEGMAPGGPQPPQPIVPPKRGPDVRPFAEPVLEKPVVVAVASPASTLAMLEDIAKYLASLRQKAITRPVISKQLDTIRNDVSELTYFVPLLKSKDLIELLSSKEFMPLHESFEGLHKALATYEPSIIARKAELFDSEDPYEILGVPYDSTKAQIQEHFKTLKSENSPAALEAVLKKQKVPAKIIKKQVKRARVTFGSVENAYKTLLNPKQKAAVDKKLQKKIEKETARERGSMRAFNQLYASLSSIVRSSLLPSIRQLLERYKPQELALARTHMEKERMQYERSKQIIKIPQTVPRENGFGQGPYDEFYRKMQAESYMRPQLPQQRFNGHGSAPGMQSGNGKGAEKAGEAGAAGSGTEKDKGKGGGGAKGGDKGSDKSPDKPKDGKSADGAKPDEKPDFAKGQLIYELSQMLEAADAQKNTIQVSPIIRSPGKGGAGTKAPGTDEDSDDPGASASEEDETKKVSLPLAQIIKQLDAELGGSRGAEDPLASARYLELFFQKHKITEMKELMKKLSPGAGKKLSNKQLKSMWKDHVFNPYGALIKNWHDVIHHELVKAGRNPNLATMHNLKLGGKAAAPGAVDLGKLRDDIHSLYESFNKVNQAFGLGQPPATQIKAKSKVGGDSK